MTRKHQLLFAAFVTAVLLVVWANSVPGRSFFADRDSSAVESPLNAFPSPEDERAAARDFLERRAASLRYRIRRAEAVDGWFSALRHLRAEGKDDTGVELMRYRLQCMGNSKSALAAELSAGMAAQAGLAQQHIDALRAAADRAAAAGYYGSSMVEAFYRVDVPTLLECSRETLAFWHTVECRFAASAERLDWMLRTMRQRTRFAAAVKNFATAKTYMNFNRPELGGKALTLMNEARAALAPQEEHDCTSVQILRARQQEITEVWEAFQQTEAAMRARAQAADYYGVAELAELP